MTRTSHLIVGLKQKRASDVPPSPPYDQNHKGKKKKKKYGVVLKKLSLVEIRRLAQELINQGLLRLSQVESYEEEEVGFSLWLLLAFLLSISLTRTCSETQL